MQRENSSFRDYFATLTSTFLGSIKSHKNQIVTVSSILMNREVIYNIIFIPDTLTLVSEFTKFKESGMLCLQV